MYIANLTDKEKNNHKHSSFPKLAAFNPKIRSPPMRPGKKPEAVHAKSRDPSTANGRISSRWRMAQL